MQQEKYLFLNSNPWFSAVSDYSLQLCLYLAQNRAQILYGAEKGSTAMDAKCKAYQIPFFYIPIHNLHIVNFIISFFIIIKLLKDPAIKKVFVFEGREHVLMMLTKILLPFLWYNKKLVRVRGQSQAVKNNFFSTVLYKYYTDKIIFTARCLYDKLSFKLDQAKSIVQYYCKNTQLTEKKITTFSFCSNFPALNFDDLTFLVLGRFDPVKGHALVLQAYLLANLGQKSNLVFIGKSENICVKELYLQYKSRFYNHKEANNSFYLEKDDKCVYMIDDNFSEIFLFMQQAHFGIIASLASEVICRVGVEFLQSGVPCIYSTAGALPEVFAAFPDWSFNCEDIHGLKLKMEQASAIFTRTLEFTSLKLQAKTIGINKYSLDNFANIFEKGF